MSGIKPISPLLLLIFLCAHGVFGQSSNDEKSIGLDAFFSFQGLRPSNPDQIYELNYLRDSTYIFLFGTDDAWVLDKKHTYLYDNQGRIVSDRSDDYEQGKWAPVSMKSLSYNSSGQLDQQLTTLWSAVNKRFENDRREHFYYNLFGLVFEKLTEISLENSWELAERRSYEYNSSYLKTLETVYSWNPDQLDWDPDTRILFDYNGKNRVSSETVQIWVDTLQSWVNQYSRDFTYDSSDQLVSTTRSEWNNNLGQWIGQSVVALSYNDKGQLESTEQFSLSESEPEEIESIEAEYDDFGNLDLTVFHQWDSENEIWEPYERHVHFWSEYLTGNLFDGKEEVTCFYANPYTVGLPWFCEGLPEDELYTLTISDLQGRTHHQQVIRGGNTFRPAGALDNGFYIITISGGLLRHTEKVLVRN